MSQASSHQNRKLILLVLSFLGLCLICCAGGLLVRGQSFRVEGFAMEPSLHDGQYILVSSLPYLFQEPQRGDVIVFRFPLNPRKNFIKRVVGLPNEKIQVHDKQIFVNTQPLSEPLHYSHPDYEWGPATVGMNEYFVLGDNRSESSDSHSWGMLPGKNIIGKAWLTYWPPADWGFVR